MFETIKNKFSSMNKTHFVLILVFVALLLGASLYTYYYYIEPRMHPNFIPNKEFIEQDPYKPAKMKFFYVDWCPHCKTAKPIWEKVKQKYHNKKINNTLVLFEEINFVPSVPPYTRKSDSVPPYVVPPFRNRSRKLCPKQFRAPFRL